MGRCHILFQGPSQPKAGSHYFRGGLRTSLADGVRQLITNQEEIFNKTFFSTVQLVFAGSDSQGLRYGTTGTPEQFFVQWKDEAAASIPPAAGALLDRPLAQMCNKTRLLDLIRNFVIFDAGQKIRCRGRISSSA